MKRGNPGYALTTFAAQQPAEANWIGQLEKPGELIGRKANDAKVHVVAPF